MKKIGYFLEILQESSEKFFENFSKYEKMKVHICSFKMSPYLFLYLL